MSSLVWLSAGRAGDIDGSVADSVISMSQLGCLSVKWRVVVGICSGDNAAGSGGGGVGGDSGVGGS